MTGTVVVVAAGDAPAPGALDGVPAGAYVIAADGGVRFAHALGLRVDLAVGDFDSAGAGEIDRVLAAGGRVERHPVAKDATDLELALDAALARKPAEVIAIGGHGGRFDHWLANALLLASPRFAGPRIEARMGPVTLTVVRGERTLRGKVGATVSLLPMHGAARHIRTEGLLYPLRDEDLPGGTTRGVSNEFAADVATVAVGEGVLLAVQPAVTADGPVDPRAPVRVTSRGRPAVTGTAP